MRRQRRAEPFADVVARVRSRPSRGPEVPEGRHGDYWGGPDQRRYELVTPDLSPADAVQLVQRGARIVYDACGCGGDECRLDWLSDEDCRRLAAADPPSLLPSKHGRADLEHWRSADGHDLIVAAVEVSWGDRIPRDG